MLGLQRFANGIAAQLYWRKAYSTSVKAATAQRTATVAGTSPIDSPATTDASEITDTTMKSKNSMVAAAFESLKSDSLTDEKRSPLSSNNTIDEKIIKAKTVNGLLAISENSGPVSRKHALKIVSILAEWSSINRVKLSEFENDSRFIKVCRVLGRTLPKNNKNGGETSADGNGNSNQQKRISGFRTDDLNTVLGVAGDDEAAKLIASISLPQMVKVLSTLAQRKRRSTPLLRSLAFNISSATEQLDLKQCADVLYAMATLNFQDSVLAAKICGDTQTGLNNCEKSAVCGSILTSLGILKYRDLDIMESLTNWVLNNNEICRPQDLSALFLTSALLNFKSVNSDQVQAKLVNSLVKNDFTKKNDWLNHVWAMAMLGFAENSHLESVLSEEFIKSLQSETNGLSATSKMKLLNLNSYAKLIETSYAGPHIADDSPVFDVPIAHSKSKEILLNGLLDALKSLLPSANHLKSRVDSRMGFLIDCLCLFDNNRNPLLVDKTTPGAIKVALMVVDYHDVCHGTHRSASGITTQSFDLLEKSGYKILPVPYNEFNTGDKLLKRVQYLEGKLKTITSNKN